MWTISLGYSQLLTKMTACLVMAVVRSSVIITILVAHSWLVIRVTRRDVSAVARRYCVQLLWTTTMAIPENSGRLIIIHRDADRSRCSL